MSTLAEPVTLDLAALIARDLSPRVTAIDLEGEYPESFLRAAGQIGAFAGVVDPKYGGSGKGLADTIAQMAKSAKPASRAPFCTGARRPAPATSSSATTTRPRPNGCRRLPPAACWVAPASPIR